MHLYKKAAAIAEVFKKELKTEDPHASKGASMYPGRFKARYFLRNEQKPFSQEKFHGIKKPQMALTLILDRSTSMDGMINDLRIMTMAIYLACESLKIPLDIWVLEGEVHLKKFDEWGPHVLAKIAGISPTGGTKMMPTLSAATKDLRSRPEELKQIIMIHDGGPHDREYVIQWRKELKQIGLYCMYIVNGSYKGAHMERKNVSMDELVGPLNYTMAFVDEMAKFWCSFMRNKQKSHSTSV